MVFGLGMVAAVRDDEPVITQHDDRPDPIEQVRLLALHGADSHERL